MRGALARYFLCYFPCETQGLAEQIFEASIFLPGSASAGVVFVEIFAFCGYPPGKPVSFV